MSLRGRRRYADLRIQGNIGTDVDSTKDIDLGTDLTVDLTASRTRKTILCEGRREEGAHGALPQTGPTGGGMAGVWGSTRRTSDPVSSLLPFTHII